MLHVWSGMELPFENMFDFAFYFLVQAKEEFELIVQSGDSVILFQDIFKTSPPPPSLFCQNAQ